MAQGDPDVRTPLEVYNQAYTFHYVENRIADACRLYKEIIREFPDSNECAYAAVQLEKIAAEEVAGKVKTGSGARSAVLWILVVINLLGLAGFGGLFWYYRRETSRHLRSVSQAMQQIERSSFERDRAIRGMLDTLRTP